MEREGRKAFIGLCLATQSLRSLVPENNSEAADKLKEVFEFIQYRFYFYFPPTTVHLLQAASGAELTETMTNRIGKYKMGECLLAVNGGENYEFKVEATTEERRLFKGGGRNAGDKVT